MEFEQEPTDQQLDELLQDITVPQDLKALLKQIPSQSQEENSDRLDDNSGQMSPASDSTERNTTKSKTWIGLILAASLIGFGLFVASHYLPNHNDAKPSMANSDNKTIGSSKGLAASKLELELEERELKSLKAQIHAIEMAQLEAKVLRVEQAATFSMDQDEVESLIAAMTEEYSIPLGLPEAKVKSGMAQVIQKFPGTRGASIAESYLERTQNN